MMHLFLVTDHTLHKWMLSARTIRMLPLELLKVPALQLGSVLCYRKAALCFSIGRTFPPS